MMLIFIFLVYILNFSFIPATADDVDLLKDPKYTWNGLNKGPTILKVRAENFTISVTIETCNIGDHNARPNKQYLIIKEGNTGKDGAIIAYVTKPKKLYFFSNYVKLELKTTTPLDKPCRVIFEKGDAEDTTLPPPTTSEATPTSAPVVSRSTVYISGLNVNDFNKKKELLLELKENIVTMAQKYTELEGFCLQEKITTENVKFHVLEQCPTKLPNFDECIRLVYSVPIEIDEECSIWKGYQLTKQHLDIMWSRLADKTLKRGLKTYVEPSVDNVITWWIIGVVVATLGFIAAVISINLTWKRRQILKRARANQNEDFMPDIRRVSDTSLTPPYFQSIPPMFDKTYRTNTTLPEAATGADNEGFQYDEILNCEEDGTTA